MENESTEEAATTSKNDMQGHVFSVPATEAKGHSVKKHDQVIKEQDKARKRLAREDDLRRKEEKEKDAAARRLAREDENKKERETSNKMKKP